MKHAAKRSYAPIMAVMAVLALGTVAYGADPAGTGSAQPGDMGKIESGTIEGEVKKVDPSVVIIEKETSGKDNGQEVRLPLNESTHKGPIKEGDKVEAFVTPGGSTTSVQPKKEGLNR